LQCPATFAQSAIDDDAGVVSFGVFESLGWWLQEKHREFSSDSGSDGRIYVVRSPVIAGFVDWHGELGC
jgi:hypothetical protein